jgi:hypothetical protein
MFAHGMYFMVIKNNNGEVYNRVNFTKWKNYEKDYIT